MVFIIPRFIESSTIPLVAVYPLCFSMRYIISAYYYCCISFTHLLFNIFLKVEAIDADELRYCHRARGVLQGENWWGRQI